jgi:hypothetical protein
MTFRLAPLKMLMWMPMLALEVPGGVGGERRPAEFARTAPVMSRDQAH